MTSDPTSSELHSAVEPLARLSSSQLAAVQSSLAAPQLKANLHVLTCREHEVLMTAAVGGDDVNYFCSLLTLAS